MRSVSNIYFNSFSVEKSVEYRMQMLKMKNVDGAFMETRDKKCEFFQAVIYT